MRTDLDLVLEAADDELVLGWRDSEWTGIAPFLEEDVAFSSIAQNEIGHARALYELVASQLGTTADELAFDRRPEEYRSAPFVELRLAGDWAGTIARRVLYEAADELRLTALAESGDPEIRGLASKIDREEDYHRLHAEMWARRLLGHPAGRERLRGAVLRLWPYALGVVDEDRRPRFVERVGPRLGFHLGEAEPVRRGVHAQEWPALWEEMTMVRRSVQGATW